jgi:hypothetical protein
LAIIDNKVYFKNWKVRDAIDYTKFATLFAGILATAAFLFVILLNSITYDTEYQNMLHTRDMLEYRIEHMEDNITGNEMLYNDIVEFNNELRSVKKWANNPWTNWFNNQDVATIDYVVLPED